MDIGFEDRDKIKERTIHVFLQNKQLAKSDLKTELFVTDEDLAAYEQQ